MSSQSTAYSVNNTFVHPEMFYISGLQDMPFANCFYIFLFIMYIVTLLCNIFVIVLIYSEQSLHNPKYLAVSHLAFVDLCSTTAIIPKLIEMFLFTSNFITYKACLANMFFVHCFNAVQSLSLVILAYDRFLAICFPLQYHSINTNSRMIIIIFSAWMFSAVTLFIVVLLITRLSFCRSTVVQSYFCDHGPVYRLACNDFYPNYIMTFLITALLVFVPLTLILSSYVAIGFALSKITTAEGRQKAFKTCTSHIILVAMFYLPLAVIYVAAPLVSFPPNVRIVCNSLSATIPPMMNPIIYTLKTDEMMESIKKLFKRIQDKDRKIQIIKALG
ncbi:olfactory receptor 1496-like [Erpetoichthys calabaricus]|uniref:olfactory receptor 1496-like n=1 Tax=Erpetoichthys calabaricus TaxID=27687 RepID=UPI0022349848|nr:olfactory receptor 1496-like [Erpetoichthys calabaricus]